jgi:basic amino acid/polyamine antiporter, APA family
MAVTAERPVQRPGHFTRKATGLVREGRTRDALIYNVMWSSFALTFAFYWLFSAFYPGSNAIVALLIAAALGLPGAFLYAMLTQLMPRTGGDYVFNSRSLHPSIGFAASVSYSFWLAVVAGVYTTYIASYGMGAFGRAMAGFTGSAGWLDFGDWFATEAGLFITGSSVLLASAAMFAFGGLRLFLRVQVVAFVLFAVGAVLVPIVVGLFQDSGGFAGQFDEYAANLGTRDAVAALGASAGEAGFAASGFDFEQTLKSVSIFWFVFGFIYSSTYFAGEIRLQKRTHLLSMPGAVGIVVLLLVLMVATFTSFADYTFNGQLGTADPTAYGFAAGAPAYPELVGIASGSAIIAAVVILGFTVSLLIWLPQTLLLVSRNMFAWSFDKVTPAALSKVDKRSRSPIVAIGVMTLLALGSTAVYSFTDWFSTVSVLLGLTITLLITAIAGALLPYRQRALVEGSPYARRVLGLPLLTVVGGLAALGFAAAIAIILWDPNSGASLADDPGKLRLSLLVLAVAFAAWWVARAVRRRQGVDLDLSYRELPAE